MARTKEFDVNETLDKALYFFWHKGYEGASMGDLVEHLGVSRSSLYTTFGNKEDLYIKALTRYRNLSQERAKQTFQEHASVIEALDKLLEGLIEESYTDPQQKGCFLVNATTELSNLNQKVQNIVSENETDMESFLKKVIQKGQEQGEISPHRDAQVLAAYIFSFMQGIRVHAMTNPQKATLENVKSMILDTLKN